jgi:hypothetical protein
MVIWFDELFDFPHHLFGLEKTPVNWAEGVTESVLVVALGVYTTWLTARFLKRIKHLEGFLPVCSFCKRIRVRDDDWVPIDQYVHEHSEAEFSHSLCPACAEEHYGELMRNDDSED